MSPFPAGDLTAAGNRLDSMKMTITKTINRKDYKLLPFSSAICVPIPKYRNEINRMSTFTSNLIGRGDIPSGIFEVLAIKKLQQFTLIWCTWVLIY